jgi:hypothetical protein
MRFSGNSNRRKGIVPHRSMHAIETPSHFLVTRSFMYALLGEKNCFDDAEDSEPVGGSSGGILRFRGYSRL